jgi:hypothetical protein
MPKRNLSLVLVTSLCLLSIGFSQNASKARLVANLKENFDGCGCYFRFWGTNPRSEKVMFVDWGHVKSWMNIAGRDVELKLVKESREEFERVGSRWTRTMAVNDISVTSTYVATRLCSQVPGCRFTDYDAIFVVRKGKRAQTVKAFGWCGC